MQIWQICLFVGLGFLVLELFAPLTFFLSFAIGAFITAIVAVFVASSTNVLVPVFAVASLVSLLIFKPFVNKNDDEKSDLETGIEGKYIGKTAKVVKQITKDEGAISIYDERWEARTINDEAIEENSKVKIVKNESLIMFVERI